jgi:hypothetical protein
MGDGCFDFIPPMRGRAMFGFPVHIPATVTIGFLGETLFALGYSYFLCISGRFSI